jgi:hypothetical protein
MWKPKRYCVFHLQKDAAEYADVVILTPDTSDAYDHAYRLFSERGHEVTYPSLLGDSRNQFQLGIPEACLRGTSIRYFQKSARREVQWFLNGIGKSFWWDFNSVAAVEFDVRRLSSEHYRLMLLLINRSSGRRGWCLDTFGFEPW